jgi:ribonucleoside-diphosphate reductase alpha chain
MVTKRDGHKEPLDLNKFHKVVTDACSGISNVSASEIELKSHVSFYNNIKTSEVQETLIKAASDLISEETPNYQYVAGRLINYNLRKEVYGKFEPDHLLDHVKRVVEEGFYTKELLDWYSNEDFNYLNSKIDYDRDTLLTYAAMEQLRGKYLVKNRVTGKFYETPQKLFMLVAMTLFSSYDDKERLNYVVDFYNATSKFDISLPTPIMAGVRTPQRQFSSCVLIETADSLDSINATSSAIVKYVSQKAGIGIGGGRIRALGSTIRNGDTSHTGVIPFYKLFQSAVKSCSQGGVRGGAATLYYPIWHLEVEDLLVLKNNKGTENNRIRHLDYGVQFNKLFYERLIAGSNITLFSPNDVPGLYDAFFANYEKFKNLYEAAEKKTGVRKKVVKAIDIFSSFIEERKDTGRIYLMNVDNCNDHGSFIAERAPIRMSNLCGEITLPTAPLNDLNDEEGEISLCTLSAINWGNIKSPSDFETPCRLAVRALDALLDYQSYPVKAAEIANKARRPLGIGIINLAYWMAKNDMTYQEPNLELIDTYTEAWSYYLIKASVDLAKEKTKNKDGEWYKPGHCERINDTKYSLGILPIDTYKKTVDELVTPNFKMDWVNLRKDLKEFGIRNSTLMALMPAETSAQISNSTNGIEPPRSLVSVKQSKDGILKQVVPEPRKLKNKYDLLWDQKSPEGYLKIMAVLQKYIDQAISVNTSYNPLHYENEKIPLSELLKHILMHYKYGGKTLYYMNTFDGATDDKLIEENELKGNKKEEEEACEACNI